MLRVDYEKGPVPVTNAKRNRYYFLCLDAIVFHGSVVFSHGKRQHLLFQSSLFSFAGSCIVASFLILCMATLFHGAWAEATSVNDAQESHPIISTEGSVPGKSPLPCTNRNFALEMLREISGNLQPEWHSNIAVRARNEEISKSFAVNATSVCIQTLLELNSFNVIEYETVVRNKESNEVQTLSPLPLDLFLTCTLLKASNTDDRSISLQVTLEDVNTGNTLAGPYDMLYRPENTHFYTTHAEIQSLVVRLLWDYPILKGVLVKEDDSGCHVFFGPMTRKLLPGRKVLFLDEITYVTDETTDFIADIEFRALGESVIERIAHDNIAIIRSLESGKKKTPIGTTVLVK